MLAAIAAAIAAAGALAAAEHRAAEPMFPAGLLRYRQFTAVAAVGTVLSIGIYGQMFVLSLFFQDTRGYSAAATGLALLPFAATTTAGSLGAGRAISHLGVRAVLLAGQLAGAAGTAILATAGHATPYPLLASGLFLLGICQAACQPGVASAALLDAPARHAGIASGVLTSGRQAGSVLGVALLGSLVASDRTCSPECTPRSSPSPRCSSPGPSSP